MKLTGALLVEDMTDPERARAERVDEILPVLRDAAEEADARAEFQLTHVKLLSEAGLLGLIVPEAYGGMGGSLRDLAAATFAMGTACPSTALAYFFHCSSASRGLLPLEAIDKGLFDEADVPVVRAFAEKVLRTMGTDGKWLANFASESVKTSTANVTIATEARRTEGGWLLKGVKAFGCATGVADRYLVTAKLEGTSSADGLAVFLVDRDAEGVRERQRWDAIGMRATATHGIILDDAFVADDDALATPGAFVTMMQVSRGSFVGNQLAATAVYAGAAQRCYDFALDYLMSKTFEDTGRPLAEGPVYAQLLGEMAAELETCLLWLRRQLHLETSEPPVKPKPEVVKQWRLSKGSVTDAAFTVAVKALKACGTSNTGNRGVIARSLRDLSMGLVQAFPAEKGRLEAATMIIGAHQQQFAALASE